MAQETDIELLPLRMLNEYAYCPRLFHLMQVEGRWEDNAYTLDGKFVHRRVDALDQVLPHAETTKEKERQWRPHPDSVFLCELNDKEFIQLNSRLQPVVHDREDQILILDLGKEDGEITTKLRSLGKVYTPMVRAKVI